jgi:hypothetical protein
LALTVTKAFEGLNQEIIMGQPVAAKLLFELFK